MFGNLEPCNEMINAVVKCVKQSKHNGYAPSTGMCRPGLFHLVSMSLYCESFFWCLCHKTSKQAKTSLLHFSGSIQTPISKQGFFQKNQPLYTYNTY